MKPLSVSELNTQIKATLDAHFFQVSVSGEISALTRASSGHVYFTLKDENSQIKATLWKGNAAKIKFALENGLAVIVNGGVKVYSPRGEYQLDCASIEPLGVGALALAYEQLKKKLALKGYFDLERKKNLPRFPKNIALITSKSGAVLQDMLNVANKRWPLVKITLFDTLVQGELAANMIASKIKSADCFGFDVIVVARGGGSMEDLWCFNEEVVADAIYGAYTPIISAVGHETDTSLSDYVADVRAPTPSAAMEILLPDINEMRQLIDDYVNRLNIFCKNNLQKKEHQLNDIQAVFPKFSPKAKISNMQEQVLFIKEKFKLLLIEKINKEQLILDVTKQNIEFLTASIIAKSQNDLNTMKVKIDAQNPNNLLKDGYAMIVKAGIKTSIDDLAMDDVFELQTPKCTIGAKVIQV